MGMRARKVLENGYTVIHKNDKYVLACKKLDEKFKKYCGSEFEYATWYLSPTAGTNYGHYIYDLDVAVEDYELRSRADYVMIDETELEKCIKEFKGAM